MPISFSWSDADKTIAHFKFEGDVYTNEYYEARRVCNKELEKLDYPVFDTIYDLSGADNLAINYAGAIQSVMELSRTASPTERYAVVVGASGYLSRWIKVGIKALKYVPALKTSFADTFDEALVEIASLRQKLNS